MAPPVRTAALNAPAFLRATSGEVLGLVAIPSGSFWRKLFAFSGPGYLVAVGYMDPGNWATGLAGGAAFGYQLLSVIILANLVAMFLQVLATKLGLVTGLDLAQACRHHYGRGTRLLLWVLCETAIIACDLAELLGAAIALKFLFGMPLAIGVCLTVLEVLLILMLLRRGWRQLEAFIVAMMLVIALCFAVEIFIAAPRVGDLAMGLIPQTTIVTDPAMLYLAIGILGATVMPHNLYLHSSLVKTRRIDRTEKGLWEAVRYARFDTIAALSLAILVNASILILAASTFHISGITDLASIDQAYQLLSPSVGVGFASTLFAVALLASGQNSSITGTLAGQIVMEGFTDLRWPSWLRRMVSRLVAMVPALAAILVYGEGGATQLLILSQVILSLQLPFAVYPLVRLTGSKKLMGSFVNRRTTNAVAWFLTGAIVIVNVVLIFNML